MRVAPKRKPNLPAAAAGRFASKLLVYVNFGRFSTLYNLSMANSQSPQQQPLKPSAAIISPGVMFEPGWRASS
tara:strand:+ start:4027 stop:4245 length:219 start_codon:yes stop_codon:yes gene_type:complete